MPSNKVYNSSTPKKATSSAVLILCVLIFCNTAQPQVLNERLLSETLGLKFYNIAHELGQLPGAMQQISEAELNEALIFLFATTQIDSRATYVFPDILSLAPSLEMSRQENAKVTIFQQDLRALVLHILQSYTDSYSDFFVLRETVENVLALLDSREEREQFIQTLLASGLQGKNNRFDSYLITKLGLYLAEKTDFEQASGYLLQAYNLDNYNHLAFSKLAEIIPEQIHPQMYLKQLRLKLVENPLDLAVALDFANFSESLELYDIAADAYSYCADLFSYLYPSESLPSSIYISWALSSYNTQRNQYKCVQIADAIRESGRFDLMLETQKSKQLFRNAEETTLGQYMENPQAVIAEQLAWFYSFANIQPMKAINWANKAFSSDPNSISTTSLLAYTLSENGESDVAKALIENYPSNQIIDLVNAKIDIGQGNTESAIEHLNSAIKKDPTSFEAELAKQILVQQGGQYLPGIDADITLQALQGELNMSVVPQFIMPQNIITVSVKMRGSKFSYDTALDSHIVMTNNSTQPLIISDNSLFQGNIRIDAMISGDINMQIPNLITKRVLPSQPIQPNRTLLIPLRFSTGRLREILKTYPQASLEIEITAYIDPIIDINGAVSNNIKDIEPASTTVSRAGVNLSRRYLQNRLDSMSTGRQGQKIQTAQLFIGLLQEQKAMANQPAFYTFKYADWMPEMLKSALIGILSDRDWTVKSNTMAEMLSLGLDYELTNAVAENLNDTKWPVRFMALYLLAKNQGSEFKKVLNWHAEHDSHAIVRDMAIALGGKKPETEIPPESQTVPQPVNQRQSSLDSYLEGILEKPRRIEPPTTVPPETEQVPQQQSPLNQNQDDLLAPPRIIQPTDQQ
ncbi:MAG: tetratricopeptide repeat protein [Planctomycetota bacterium]|jgi:hypothetical protein